MVVACCVLDSLYYWGRFSGGNMLAVTVLNALFNVFHRASVCCTHLYLDTTQQHLLWINTYGLYYVYVLHIEISIRTLIKIIVYRASH